MATQIRLTSLSGERPIQAIKAVRSVTGLGLKEAKAVVDNVRGWAIPPQSQVIELAPGVDVAEGLRVLRDAMLTADLLTVDTLSIPAVVVDALRRMPRRLSVQDVLDVLDAVS